MRVSELAASAGLSVHTIRYYEKMGLLNGGDFTIKPNNYRDYTPAALETLRLVKIGKTAGFSLPELAEVLKSLSQGKPDRKQRNRLLKEKLAEIEKKISDLTAIRDVLKNKLSR